MNAVGYLSSFSHVSGLYFVEMGSYISHKNHLYCQVQGCLYDLLISFSEVLHLIVPRPF